MLKWEIGAVAVYICLIILFIWMSNGGSNGGNLPPN
jgi:hypothetical protein